MARCLSRWIGVLAVLAGLAAQARAQEGESTLARTLRGPRFLSAASGGSVPIDIRQSPLLHRRISINFDRVTLKDALAEIARQAQMPLVYSKDVVPLDKLVRLRAENITVAGALSEVLLDAAVDVLISADGRAALVRQAASSRVKAASGTVVGKVTDVKTGEVIVGAEVWLEGTKLRATTNEKGFYKLTVEPGSYTLGARRVGYAKHARSVTVVSEQEVTVDVALQPVATQLNEIVTTVTGEQRVLEMGHVVARINVDSLVKEAPITSMSELLQSRVPGLQVLTGNGGVVGGAVSLQLRGQSSLNLNSEPIVIVDGVRYTSNNQVVEAGSARPTEDNRGQGELRSPLNDLNVNDIETVEVVKGPSASTLYGPDAANGVIVITTKSGKPGKSQFRWYVRPVSNSVPTKQEATGYRIWSHDPNTGEPSPYTCTLVYQYKYNACIVDSITAARTVFGESSYSLTAKNRPTWQYGASLGGGTQALRYLFAGNYESQIGSFEVPSAFREYLEQQVGSTAIDDVIRNPNTLRTVGVRTNLSANVLRQGTVTLSAGYSQSAQRRTDVSGFSWTLSNIGALTPGADTADGAQYVADNIAPYFNPGRLMYRNEDRSNRLTAALTGTFVPVSWLTLNASVGLDVGVSTSHGGAAPGLVSKTDGGAAQDDRRNTLNRTASIGATAVARPGRWSFRTSIGAQYAYQRLDGLSAVGWNLAPGSTSIGTAISKTVRPLWLETASLGSYGEEVVGYNDRLFLTGSLRLDGSTSFGDAYTPRPYPKVGFSWLASEEPFLHGLPGVSDLRFRASYGAASRYPTSAMKLGLVYGVTAPVEGSGDKLIFDRSLLASPDLRPERSREAEWGVDVTLLSRLNVGLTWWQRQTDDQLQQLSNTAGLPPNWGNLGTVKGHGFEVTAHATVLETRAVRADLAVGYSFRTDKLLSLGRGNTSAYGYVVGRPLSAVYSSPIIGVADTVGGVADGIAYPEEAIRDTFQFIGVSVPPRTLTLTPSVTLAGGRVRFSALFDRQTGFVASNAFKEGCFYNALCIGPFVASTPVFEQARYAAGDRFFEPGDFTRWREFTISVDVPAQWLRLVHLARGSFSLQGRNLAIWTDYQGSDPESRSGPGLMIPGYRLQSQARGWSFRFDVAPAIPGLQ